MIIFLLLYFTLAIENAVIVILCRNSDKNGIMNAIRSFEEMFNKNYHYPYVFLNDEYFTEDFKNGLRSIVSGTIEFGKLEPDEWEVPAHIDKQRMERGMKEMESKKIIYGGSLSYRKMCRFFSGKMFNNKYLQKYDYYWRIEPDVKFLCKINYDPFKFLRESNKEYGFVIALREFMETIPSLFDETLKFMTSNLNILKNSTDYTNFILNTNRTYNGCHFWSNFEIASFKFFRSEAYKKYFEWLDRTGGFFYERWGDAPVHSLAVSMFLGPQKIHFFSDIGYEHPPFQHCPAEPSMRSQCNCSPSNSLDFQPFSCLKGFLIDQLKYVFF